MAVPCTDAPTVENLNLSLFAATRCIITYNQTKEKIFLHPIIAAVFAIKQKKPMTVLQQQFFYPKNILSVLVFI